MISNTLAADPFFLTRIIGAVTPFQILLVIALHVRLSFHTGFIHSGYHIAPKRILKIISHLPAFAFRLRRGKPTQTYTDKIQKKLFDTGFARRNTRITRIRNGSLKSGLKKLPQIERS